MMGLRFPNSAGCIFCSLSYAARTSASPGALTSCTRMPRATPNAIQPPPKPMTVSLLLPPLPCHRRQRAAFAVAGVLVVDPVVGIDVVEWDLVTRAQHAH